MIRIAAMTVVLAVAMAVAPPPAAAQQVQRIAAIVNDDVISVRDLQQRTTLVIRSSDIEDTPEMRARLAPQVLRALIDERLQLQEARRRNVSVQDDDIAHAKEILEQQNNIPPGQLDSFLNQMGVPRDALMQQIRAQIAWLKLVQRRLRPNIQIGDEEIDAALERMQAREGQPQFHVAEIYLDIPNPGDEPEVRAVAERLVEQLRGGADFASLARQFSQSASAPAGGEVGWVGLDDLGEDLRGVVSRLRPDEVSDPIRTLTGFTIVRLHETRRGGGNAGSARVELHQLQIPVTEETPAALEEGRALAARTADAAESCEALAALAEQGGLPPPTALGTFALGELAGEVREAVADLAAGQASRPLRNSGGWQILMVCAREAVATATPADLPAREEIREMLVLEREELMARRYLRDLRQAAIIDVRV